MPRIAVSIGLLLVAVGVVAYAASGDDASPTSLIPAALGVVIAVAGVVGLRGGPARRHAMHAAAAVALIGALGSIGQLIARPAADSDAAGVATGAGIANLVLCAAFVALAVRSFRQARLSR